MPPLLTSDIVKPAVKPVVNRSPHRMVPVIKVPPPRPLAKPRIYTDEPLPFRLSDHAPRKATIKQRVALPDRVAYTLEIGGIDIEDVGIHEVLDYVSAYDLEQFEHRQFEEEREIMRIAKLEREAEREERRKQRAKTKGQVIWQSESDTGSEEDDEVETGKHGRARPTYKHMFKAPEMRQRRRRRKRDPFTGELMPLSDEEEAAFVAPSKVNVVSSPRAPASAAAELPKRRRRKRDKITGELLPLSPDEQAVHAQASIEKGKRPRRRRHPITGELMPLGWRYDPNAEKSYEQRRDGAGGRSTPAINRLSITREHDAKRVKLTSEEPSSDDELSTKQPVVPSKWGIPATNGSRNSSSSREPPPPPMSISKSKPTPTKTSMLNPISHRASRPGPSTSATDSSSEPKITLASFLKPSKPDEDDDDDDSSADDSSPPQKVNTPGKTSIMNPMAAQTEDESEAEDEDLEEGEWFVEAILDHHLSDPRTHPGKKQIMLYKTKWEGYKEPTWEPEDSFVDQFVLHDYRKRVGLGRTKKQVVAETKKPAPPTPKTKAPPVIDESDEEEEEEEDYEVESILGHHMSDPRTHPGRPATMLYKVKWLGWPEPTWEPRHSFTDKTIVRKYEKRVGLKPEESDGSDDGDTKMRM
ncbi:hypothetical protein PRZ48_006344 [Zasmidium cellare]|uniref:Chromo domain-containing protein n=1 Tax=Zasmidium cellare TaxID=395010 RepID=A0ABR0EN42_ZASCE|nr:hypothetical protein PRZ48_006344 [Zasmidium cellare]